MNTLSKAIIGCASVVSLSFALLPTAIAEAPSAPTIIKKDSVAAGASTQTSSNPAAPQRDPIYYNLYCIGDGSTSRYVQKFEDCRNETVKLNNTKSGETDGSVDMYKLTNNIKSYDTWAQVEADCNKSILCRIGATVTVLKFGPKLKAAWTVIRAAMG